MNKKCHRTSGDSLSPKENANQINKDKIIIIINIVMILSELYFYTVDCAIGKPFSAMQSVSLLVIPDSISSRRARSISD